MSLWLIYSKHPREKRFRYVRDYSSLTHAHQISVFGCYLYTVYLEALIRTGDKVRAYEELCAKSFREFSSNVRASYGFIVEGGLANVPREQIPSSGYVVDTMIASLWCLLREDDYRSTVLAAVNIGEDTDTVGAVAGSLAGILYGAGDIPGEFLDVLARREYLEDLAERFDRRFGQQHD